ncbi:MAG: Lipid-A-disaccharide synthase [Planctomycetes bacterium]|nr:Lipid-A-disaccharide synthase [Planctomycetota bacterium]
MRRFAATAEASWTALCAAFGFVPFLPRLVRAAFTGPADRRAMAETIRAGLAEPPSDAPAQSAPPSPGRPVRVLMIAGEPSGDLHASNLARAMLAERPGSSIEGIGGPRMAAAGVRVTTDLVSEPVMGVWPVVREAPRFFRLYRDLLVRFDEDPPDLVVGVDYPGLNLRLARAARKRGIPFVLFVAPQVWAWAPWRAKTLARDVTRIVAILPFERSVFGRAGADVVYVGHPLFEHVRTLPRDDALRATLRARGSPVIALLPGSRRSEVRGNLPVILDAAKRVLAAHPGASFVIPLASERLMPAIEAALARADGPRDVFVSAPGRGDDAMACADAAISVSGTATLHLAAHGVPAVVVYRASAAGRALSKLLLVSPWFALPNLLAGREALPELLVSGSDGTRVAEALLPLLPGGAGREAALEALRGIRERVGDDGASARAARAVLAVTPLRAS